MSCIFKCCRWYNKKKVNKEKRECLLVIQEDFEYDEDDIALDNLSLECSNDDLDCYYESPLRCNNVKCKKHRISESLEKINNYSPPNSNT